MSTEQPPSYHEKDEVGQLRLLEDDSNGMGSSEAGIEELLETEVEETWEDLGLSYDLYETDETELMVNRETSEAILYVQAWENKLPVASCTVRVCPHAENPGAKNFKDTRNYKPPTRPDVDVNESNLWLFYKSNI